MAGAAAARNKEVTLAFTDIEGSTRLLHELGDAYLAVLAVHHDRMRAAVAAHGGTVVRTEGDSFFLAFDDPAAAVAACVEAQRTLAADGWPHGRQVRVRMGVHRGRVAAVEVNGEYDYIGLAVHEAARVTDAGTGGTILVTDAVAEAVREQLLDDVVLDDLGLHRLRDFPAPCRLWAVLTDGATVATAPLRVAPSSRSQLPAPPARLVGRDDELERLAALVLGPARLVTLTGPGGVGKTRLALEAAWQMRGRFSAGPWFVDLAAVTAAEGVVAATLAALRATDESADPLDTVRAAVGTDPSLLILDNFEQVREGAGFVARLLEACPELRIIVTSRERLRLRAEHTVILDGLPAADAAALLRDRAQAAGVVLGDDAVTRRAGDELCEHLGGLPLAIELAAAHTGRVSLASLLDELRQGLDILANGPVDLPPRHQALRATIAWSVDLLTPAQRQMLEALSVFAGGAALPEIVAVARALGVGEDCEDLVAELIDKSLVHPADGKPDRPRVTMQEVVRQYAEEQMRAAPPRWSAAVNAHVEAMAALARAAVPHLEGADQASWLDVLAVDHDNLRVALERAPADRAAGIAVALPLYWTARGHWSEARNILERLLNAGGADEAVRADLRAGLAYYCERQGDLAEAEAHATEALDAAQRSGDRVLCARIANTLGDVAAARGAVEAGGGWYEKALAWADEAGDGSQRSVALSNLGVLAWQHDRLDEARTRWTAALALSDQLGHKRSVAILTGDLGLLDRLAGDLDSAEARFRACFDLAHELGDPIAAADASLNLGVVAKDRGDEAAARDLYMDALTSYERLGHVRFAAVALLHLALATDDLEQAQGWARAARTRAIACDDQLRIGESEAILAALAELEADGH